MSRSLQVAIAPICISSGYCRNRLPEVFEQQAGNKGTTVRSNPVAETDVLWDAMEGCPVEAISARDAGNGELVFPEA